MKYREKSYFTRDVEAMKFERNNMEELHKFTKDRIRDLLIPDKGPSTFRIETQKGSMFFTEGDYVEKDSRGDFYPCKPETFEKLYERI